MNGEKSIKATVIKFERIMETDILSMHFMFGYFYCEDSRTRSHFIAVFGSYSRTLSTKKYLNDPQKISKNLEIQDILHNLPIGVAEGGSGGSE